MVWPNPGGPSAPRHGPETVGAIFLAYRHRTHATRPPGRPPHRIRDPATQERLLPKDWRILTDTQRLA